jgi:uncharacterized protein YjfI (DUF2170 family)
MRQRLKGAGLVKREFWILPENVGALQGIEKQLRQPFLGERVKLERFMTTSGNWTIDTLRTALSELDVVKGGSIALGEADASSITLTMAEHGDLPIFIGVSGDQILVDTTLIEVAKVKDVDVFNNLVLRSRDLFPLSSVGVETIDGIDVYCMFGALSAASELTVIFQEILALAENVIRAVDAYEDHFNL